jgi:hypothetical protein
MELREMADEIVSRRFSLLHLERGGPERDSKKARFRLYKLAEVEFPSVQSRTGIKLAAKVQTNIEAELGIHFGTALTNGRRVDSWEWFFDRISIVELLDCLTIMYNVLDSSQYSDVKRFLAGARRVFLEENVAYSIDDEGIVHPLIDTAFTALSEASIAALSGPRNAATLERVNAVDGFLLQAPADYKGAIRAVFGANENLFKLMYGTPRLDAKSVGDNITKDQQKFYSGHSTLLAVGAKTVEGYKQWINAAHFYRHEEGLEEPNQPTEEVAILLISQGLSYVRWLAQIDTMKNA